jgi:hypothetical protein
MIEILTRIMEHGHDERNHNDDGDVREYHEQREQQMDPPEDEDEREGGQQPDGKRRHVRVHQPGDVNGGEVDPTDTQGSLKYARHFTNV